MYINLYQHDSHCRGHSLLPPTPLPPLPLNPFLCQSYMFGLWSATREQYKFMWVIYLISRRAQLLYFNNILMIQGMHLFNKLKYLVSTAYILSSDF